MLSKPCSVCKQELPLEAYTTQKRGYLGKRADCNECKKRFIRTRHGLVGQIYQRQRAKSVERGHPMPTYNQTQLYTSMLKNHKFEALYQAWVISGYNSRLIPSVDRIDDSLPYQKGNLQLMTWEENNLKANASMAAGDYGVQRSVDMLDKKGKFIRAFKSVSEAAEYCEGQGSVISGAAKGRVTKRTMPDGSIRYSTKRSGYGHLWRYSET